MATRCCWPPERSPGRWVIRSVSPTRSLNERATEARKEFQAVVDKYPHTRASDFSHYFLGTTAASVGDNGTAERELKTVAGYHNEDLSSLAKMALASVYRNSNRTQDSVNLYKELINKPTRTVSKPSLRLAAI